MRLTRPVTVQIDVLSQQSSVMLLTHLQRHKIPVESGVVTRAGVLGRFKRFICVALDGNLIEIVHY